MPLFLGLAARTGVSDEAWVQSWKKANPVWRGIHVMVQNDRSARDLMANLDGLKTNGVNAIIAEVDYGFAFKSHPELYNDSAIKTSTAKELSQACHERGIRLVPQMSCLGHQSWSKTTYALLTRHPEFDETPGQYPTNTGIYCRSWCPQHPDINKVVFSLVDDMIDGFEADGFHVGMDEVFIIASEYCQRCKGGDPAKLFARCVNDLHGHIVDGRKVEMFMWADRFLDSRTTGYGEWEAAKNGTAAAVDLVPKDIVMCDWHYEPLDKYPGKPSDYNSIAYLQEHGFRVWPCGWKRTEPVAALVATSRKHQGPKMVGYLQSTWGAVKIADLKDWPPLKTGFDGWK
ncbi:MAG TPA: family 20 glycosylhydrolase [Candidatus Limnocylindria bacterium]|nr:family 20 glycosylhydrolase [Candidatus Limnocylindria bacterium]